MSCISAPTLGFRSWLVQHL